MFSPHDLGYRYLLPVLPFLFVASADVIKAVRHIRWAKVGIILLIGWQIVGTLQIYPYYLTFFNEFVANADRGRYILSDSNIDWGQDLIGLKHYVEQQQISQIKLSFFGVEHPSTLNLRTEALPPIHAAMTDQGAWWLHTYYPTDPPPGVYAISVANLMGGIWIDSSTYAYFRNRQPDAIIGGSIYIYTVQQHGAPIDLALGGLQVEQIDPATFAGLGTNDARLRWFDATSALISPLQPTWSAIHHAEPIAPEFVPLFKQISPKITAYTNELTIVTYWRAGNHLITPLKIFVHALNASGQVVAQQDLLTAPAEGWHPGDWMAQINRLSVPPQTGPLWLEIGLYNPDSNARLAVTFNGQKTDRLLLKQINTK